MEGQPGNAELINHLFRAVHTIKGSAGIFGFDDVVAYAHIAESVMDKVRSGEVTIAGELIATFLAVGDTLRELIEFAISNAPPSEEIQSTITAHNKILSVYLEQNNSDEKTEPEPAVNDIEEVTEESEAALSQLADWHISLRFNEDVLQAGMDPASFIKYLSKLGEVKQVKILTDNLPDLSDINPELSYLGFELTLLSDTSKQEIESVFEFVIDDADIKIFPPFSKISEFISRINELDDDESKLGAILIECGALTQSELEAGLEAQNSERDNNIDMPIGEVLVNEGILDPTLIDAALSKQDSDKNKRIVKSSSSVRVDAGKLDHLINLVGEVVIAGAGSNLLAQKVGNEELTESMSVLGRLVEEIRDNALRLRMVQIGDTFKRFKRVVRDVSKELNKDIALTIDGGETELDKTVIEKIGDPLMHLVRNSMDHGIESSEVRKANGKPERGTVKLSAYHDSGSIIVEISDDGAGLNKDRILELAKERNVIAANATPTDEEIHNLIFEAGFSTAQTVTNLSGRGVGMDVVRRNIEELSGTISLSSVQGEGTLFSIRLPLTLAIVGGFVVLVNETSYVIPLEMVVECIELDQQLTAEERDKNYINLRGEVLPLMHLSKSFGLEHNEIDRGAIVVVQAGHHKAGLVVDELQGEFQTVIKPLGELFEHIPCVSGSTILGSGEVAIILDIPGLIKLAIDSQQTHSS